MASWVPGPEETETTGEAAGGTAASALASTLAAPAALAREESGRKRLRGALGETMATAMATTYTADEWVADAPRRRARNRSC